MATKTVRRKNSPPVADVVDVKTRLLQAAAELFVQHGFAGVSIREIADQASANSALISYYFGDKEGLFLAVLKQAADPINQARMQRFDALWAEAAPALEDVVAAWIEPMFDGATPDGPIPVASLSLSLTSEYGKLSEQLVVQNYDAMNERFLQLLERCLPQVARATLVWRLYFLVGAVLTATRHRTASMKHLSGGVVDGRDWPQFVAHLVQFSAAGFSAADPAPRKGAKVPVAKTGSPSSSGRSRRQRTDG